MANVITGPADIANLALQRIGYPGRVGNLYDGSEAAKDILDIYGQVRDQLLRGGDWPFASRSVVATLLKSAPLLGYFPPNVWTNAYPPQPWRFSYEFPTECLEVRACKPQVYFVPDFAPQQYLFSIANDNGYTPARRVVLSNVSDAMLTYCAQITDPLTMPPDFIEAFAAELGQRLAASLVKSLEMTKLEAADAAKETSEAESRQG